MIRIINSEIRYLSGVGEKKAGLYQKLGVKTFGDLLELYPRRYINYNDYCLIEEARPGRICAVKASLVSKSPPVKASGGRVIFKALAGDENGDELVITFFNNQYALSRAFERQEYIFYGKIAENQGGKEILSPYYISAKDKNKIVPVYPLTAGLSSFVVAKDVQHAYRLCAEEIKDCIPQELRLNLDLCHRAFAIKQIHFPDSMQNAQIAKRRLVFEELFTLSLALAKIKNRNTAFSKIKTDKDKRELRAFIKSLPFTLTNGQLGAIRDCFDDISGGKLMNRLIQGDVGSGKTAVAAAAAYCLIKNGWQCAIMAPTEILARQHYETFSKFFAPFGFKCGLLTGSLSAKQKRETLARISSGEVDFVAGTNALIFEGVNFARLGLVITDEQHRFGVRQRTGLALKGQDVHTLVMSATPIPRTLALILYGDLDISLIKELPPGRRKTDTLLIRSGKRARAYSFIRSIIDDGGQAYIVCPLVRESETEGAAQLLSVNKYGEEIAQTELAGYSVGILHGKMKSKEKENIMSRFYSGELSALVSTTVIEVGVDVPNASVMLIENAERFGLSQLHQLRGRIGRGNRKSYCILITDSMNADTVNRLGIVVKTNDGFVLAEEDLKIRGPGDFFGNRQHGLPEFKIADVSADADILALAIESSKKILTDDPDLTQPANLGLAQNVQILISKIAEGGLN
ncbi:MAG: ATP-dependent DNA helicase RecG [Oscillospiraceae bacterium]|nr:ATP-dependent DNA helicase RecG [Oscillospiraceae bacterium]